MKVRRKSVRVLNRRQFRVVREKVRVSSPADRVADALRTGLVSTDLPLRLAVFATPRENQILLAAVFDNLGKGASGAAVQNLDLMLGRR